MSAHADGKTDEVGEKLRALMRAVATDDTSVSSRELEAAYAAAPNDPMVKILDAARAATARARALVDEPTAESLTTRRSEGERLLKTRTKELVSDLDPWIMTRRAQLFGAETPPCHSLAAAARWIEEAARSAGTRQSAVEDEVDALIDTVEGRLFEADPWGSYRLEGTYHHLRYWKPNGEPGSVVVSRTHQQLYGVYRASEQVAELTTLPPATVAAWLLIGIRPGQRVRLTTGRTLAMPGLRLVTWRIRRPQVSVHGPARASAPPRLVLDLDVRDLNDRMLRVARREATKSLERWAPLTSKQRRVVEVVRRLGGPPTPKFARPFWNRVAKQLKGEKDAIAVAKLYYRAAPARTETTKGK